MRLQPFVLFALTACASKTAAPAAMTTPTSVTLAALYSDITHASPADIAAGDALQAMPIKAYYETITQRASDAPLAVEGLGTFSGTKTALLAHASVIATLDTRFPSIGALWLSMHPARIQDENDFRSAVAALTPAAPSTALGLTIITRKVLTDPEKCAELASVQEETAKCEQSPRCNFWNTITLLKFFVKADINDVCHVQELIETITPDDKPEPVRQVPEPPKGTLPDAFKATAFSD